MTLSDSYRYFLTYLLCASIIFARGSLADPGQQFQAPSAPEVLEERSTNSPSLPIATPSPAKTNVVDGTPSALGDFTRLKLEMHQASHEAAQSPESTSDLASALEEAIQQVCMPQLPRVTSYTPPKHPNECTHYIERLLALIPGHAAALCARDGFQASSCIDAFEAQELAYLSAYSPPRSSVKQLLESKLTNSKVDAQVSEMSTEYASFRRQKRAPYDPETVKQLMRRLNQIMHLACVSTIVRYQAQGAGVAIRSERKARALQREPFRGNRSIESRPVPQPTSQTASSDPLGTFEASLGIGRDVRKDLAPAAPVRVRYLSDACVTHLSDALSLSPGDPTAICYREGIATPRCLAAVEHSRKVRAKSPPAKSPPSQGFSTF